MRVGWPVDVETAHCAFGGTQRHDPKYAAARHRNKARQNTACRPLTDPDRRPGALRRPARAAARRAGEGLCRAIQRPSARERDAAELYGPPDGYVDADGNFHKERRGAGDKPVYEVELKPEDGLYPLPYMARQTDGSAWEEECAQPLAPAERARQAFFPDGSRSFEEVDRLLWASTARQPDLVLATFDFYPPAAAGGYTRACRRRAQPTSAKAISRPKRRGHDFFPYQARHSRRRAAATGARAHHQYRCSESWPSGKYDGAIWTQGSPRIEETIYWFNLLIDTTLPICGNAAQRPQGQMSNDGPKNLVDSLEFIDSRVWADEAGRNRAGVVLIQEQQIFAAREVQKADARPGGYVATGGHGGILGASGYDGRPMLHYLPATATPTAPTSTFRGSRPKCWGVRRRPRRARSCRCRDQRQAGDLLDSAIP